MRCGRIRDNGRDPIKGALPERTSPVRVIAADDRVANNHLSVNAVSVAIELHSVA
jgi:hypothetical protein